ncbi:diguanylate phosphodiesterase [Photobacterium jeanii]|uniref:Diguanylate phosphodiesterase n=2 Tax=Vibrionaceae TaxID=641 RepID=A0A178KPJ6_9GAMM|nr:ABC transporter substrate binding protein [Photobacterium jeanii]OAN19161.1 diguanylate phosphodiesterase [Photobacterium jeanii]PST87168.1 PAS domain S-box protein [Photobacterium jeanii]
MRILFLLLSVLTFSAVASPSKILIIHSYHQGLRWTDSIQAGLEVATNNRELTFSISYMDSKRYQSPGYLNELLDVYRTKLKKENYDAIVVSDDHALWLVNQLGEFVGDTPVVFGGINNYSAEKHNQLTQVAGVVEMSRAVENIKLAKTLQPGLTKLYLLADRSYTGQELWRTVETYRRNTPDLGVELIQPPNYKFDDMLAFTRDLPSDSAIILLLYFKDGDGQFRSSSTFVKQLTEQASVPVYVMYNFMLQYGATGGVVTSGYDQGTMMGKLLGNVLDDDIASYPVLMTSPSQLMLNSPMLEKWGIEAQDDQALLMNQPQNWFERYKKELRTMAITVLLMGPVIILLSLMIRRQRKSEQQLQQSQALFEGVFDQSFQYIAILEAHGTLVSANLALQNLLGRGIMKYDRPVWRWHCWDQDGSLQLSQAFLLAQSDQMSRFTAEAQSSEGHRLMLDITIKRMPQGDSESGQMLLEARDITARSQMEEKLRDREVSYSLLYEQQPVILLTIDSQARIQSVNQFAADLLGYNKREMLGHKVTDFYFQSDAMLPHLFVSSVKQGNEQQVWRRQLQYRCANGNTVWIRETIRPAQSKKQLLLVGEDITSTHELEAKLEYQACHDYLTDLFNRSYFEQQLEQVLIQARDKGARHAMFYIDLDQFKVINDTAGHEAGDEALKQVALLLQSITPSKATLARLGGDEFAVILRHCNVADAVAFGKEILMVLEEAEFYWQNTRFNFSCSLGIRLIDETAGSPQQVHAQADTACYAAKDEGRNRLHLYHPDDEELKRRELEMAYVNHIHEALAEKRLELHAQQIAPLTDTTNGKHHYEILVRMRNQDGSMVSPGLFIPAAERYNLAHLIDRYVVQEVLEWLQANPAAIAQLEMCSINLSGQSMGNRDFVEFLVEQIRSSGLPTEKLCLEITETAAIGNMSEAIQLFTQLKSLGCMISLDDFGSGLSSFGYLKRLPVDIIKIDGMFVRDIDEDDMDLAMVKAINELAKKMGKQTVAEFVENQAILDKLRDLGVDYAQGYLFGKPQPLADLVAQLSQDHNAGYNLAPYSNEQHLPE